MLSVKHSSSEISLLLDSLGNSSILEFFTCYEPLDPDSEEFK